MIYPRTQPIIEYNGNTANAELKRLIFNNITDNTLRLFIFQFMNESYIKKCYVIKTNDDEIISICLLRKCDCDPYQNISKKQKDPYILTYIYTVKKYRKQSYAYNLLKNIKENITAFCDCQESINLFKKANYIFLQNDPTHKHIAIYRTNDN
jgi:hypothetical protein